jgi:hypothetical protein
VPGMSSWPDSPVANMRTTASPYRMNLVYRAR